MRGVLRAEDHDLPLDQLDPLAAEEEDRYHSQEELDKLIKKLRKEMKAAADRYDFERAAELRDRIFKLEGKELELRP